MQAAALAVRVRCTGLTAGDVERSLWQERIVVRTWCMRGALHLIATEDPGWLLPLLVTGRIAASRRRHIELGLIVEPVDTLTPDIRAGLETEVQDLARFLGVKAILSIMEPIK